MTSGIDFVRSEFWILSWGASVQRAGIFSATATERSRSEFRARVISFAETDILPTYLERVSEAEHESNIARLSNFGSEVGTEVLRAGYRVGIAQKLLNLQLKYLWCLGSITEPPHCPVDRVMINRTRLRGKVAWTRIDNMREYRRVIDAMKAAKPPGLSLAEWELQNYDRADA